MLKKWITNNRRSACGIFLAVLLAVNTAAAPAFAASTPGTPVLLRVKIVEWIGSQTGGNQLVIQLSNNVNYYAMLDAAGCTENNQSMDSVKMWQSLAQSALLSGKNVRIYFNICNGANYITALDLNQ